jgi:dinuclear metal center YbgI/SA1388 family protein
MSKFVLRDDLENFLNQLLMADQYEDYGPNGLQIEGRNEIRKIAYAVSATRESIEMAIEKKADALIVHHGLFWKFHGVRPLKGTFAKRVLPLVRAEINLFGHHLPLDGHIKYGNAACLAQMLELQETSAFGEKKGMPIGVQGKFKVPQDPTKLKQKISEILNHDVLHAFPESPQKISSMGIITGGANSEWTLAAELGLDSYLTGEMSEHDWHESKEGSVHMFAGGHNATEQFGVQALKELIEKEFGVPGLYISSPNPA